MTLTSSQEETSKKLAEVGLKFTDEIVSFGGDSTTNSLVAGPPSASEPKDIFVFINVSHVDASSVIEQLLKHRLNLEGKAQYFIKS